MIEIIDSARTTGAFDRALRAEGKSQNKDAYSGTIRDNPKMLSNQGLDQVTTFFSLTKEG